MRTINDAETVKNNISELNITWPTNIIPEAKDLIIKILKINPSERPSIETKNQVEKAD